MLFSREAFHVRDPDDTHISLLSGEATAGVDELDVARSRLQLWAAANIIR